MIQHDVSSKGEIGRIILREGTRLDPGEQIQLRFVNGSAWLGSITVSRDAQYSDDYSQEDNLSFNVEGNLFEGDRSIQIAIVCEPDGPIDWPICHGGRIYNNDDESEYGNQVSAQFYADGPGWNADNAPKLKPFFISETVRESNKLASAASKAQEKWCIAKKLLKVMPETNNWPQPMPKPSKPQRVVSSGSQNESHFVLKEKIKAKTIKPGIHKRLSTGEKVAVYG